MARRVWAVGLFLWAACAVLAADPSSIPVDLAPGLRGEVLLDLDPAPGKWTPDEKAAAGETCFQGENGYALRLAPVKDKGTERLQLELKRGKNQEFAVRSYGIRFQIPRRKIAGVWHTQVPVHRSLFLKPPDLEFRSQAAANVGMPFVLAADEDGNALAAIGWIDQALLTECSARLINKKADLQFELIKKADPDSPLKRKVLKDALFRSAGKRFWFDAARDYSRTVDLATGYKPNPIPESAKEPVYCTWPALGDGIREARLWENAVKAKEAGIGTIVIGPGWDTPAGGSWGDPIGPYGDFHALADKFPDFPGLIGRMQKELGLKVELWAAPFRVGRGSKAQRRLKIAKLSTERGEDFDLCPRHELTKAHLASLCSRLMEELKLDGLRLDLMDSIPNACAGHHVHRLESEGEAFTACASAIRDAVTVQNRAAVLDYRLAQANLNNKPFANLMSTSDAPYDWEKTRLQGVLLRTFADGVLIGAGPAGWHSTDSDAQIGKCCAAMLMGGVPSFSLDLVRTPVPQLEILRAWLGFYRDNREELLSGAFRPFGADFTCPDARIEGKTAAFIYLQSGKTKQVEIQNPDIKRAVLMNGTDSDEVSLQLLGLPMRELSVTIYDPGLHPIATQHLRATVEINLDLRIPQGGMAVLQQ